METLSHYVSFGVAIGLAGLATKTLIIPFIANKVWPKLLAMISSRIVFGLDGGDIADPDIRNWLKDVTFATVVLAEKKNPDGGLGKEKYEYVFKIITGHYPWIGPFLDSAGESIEKLIEDAVIDMDKMMKKQISSRSKKKKKLKKKVVRKKK